MHEHHIARTLTSEEQHRRMLQTPVPKLVLSLAAPTVASQLISIIYNTADTYFVSQISTSASAAVGVVFSLSSIIQAYGFGVAMGTSSLISLRLGEKKDRDANGYASSGFFAELVGGLLILIFGLLFLEPLMRVLGATETMLPHACAYGRIILMGAPIMCCSFVLNCVLRAEGAAVVSMVGLCSGGLINIALDPLFIFTFEMGTAQKHCASAPEVRQLPYARLWADHRRGFPDHCPAGHGESRLGAHEHSGCDLRRRGRRGAHDLQ